MALPERCFVSRARPFGVITRIIARFRAAPLLAGTAVLFLGAVGSGFINYVFSIVMARERFLGPQDFGTLSALLSGTTLVGLVGSAISTVTAQYTASFVAARDVPSVGRFLRAVRRRLVRYGVPACLLFMAISRPIADFLHVESVLPVILLAPLTFLTLLLNVSVGALQGMLAFTAMTVVSMGGAALRLLFSLVAVGKGFGVPGVLAASLGANAVVYALSGLPLRSYIADRTPASRIPRRDVLLYGGPVLVTLFGVTAFFTVDVILAKHFLSAVDAGVYSGLAVLGRVAYFMSLPFIHVMFPTVTQARAAHRSLRPVVFFTLGPIFAVTVLLVVGYRVFAREIITWTIGAPYLAGHSVLWLLALFMSCVSIASWIMHYLLAHRSTGAAWVFPGAAVLQMLFIARFHATVTHLVLSSVAAAGLLLVAVTVLAVRWRMSARRTRVASEPYGGPTV